MKDKSNRLISSARCQYLHSVWTSAEDFADFAAAVLDRKPINVVAGL